jgi:hypothetical protein
MTAHIVARVLLLSLAIVARPGGARPADTNFDRELAGELVEVATTQGRVLRGRLDGFREGRLHLLRATDGGEVGYSVARDEIARLELPGAELEARALEVVERGDLAEALPALGALARQRARYLPLLDAEKRRVLLAFVTVNESAGGDAYATIGFARQLASVAGDDERAILDEAMIRAHLRLGLRDEARRLAEAWCARAQPDGGSSAFGWAVLARLAEEEGDSGQALWLALQPIAFANHIEAAGHEECFTIAVRAARRLGHATEAAALAAEMRERGYTVPPELPVQPAERATAARNDPSSSAAPPPQTLDDVRKLTRRPSG